jgi:O-antigen/teichoic acid export membrane protein
MSRTEISVPAPALCIHWDKHRRLIGWLRLLAGYSFVQAVAQGLGFLAGIMVVRSLSKEDYACFMIVNTVGPLMNMLSDNGITTSLASIGGKFWGNDERMGSLVNTAMILRKRLVVVSIFVVTPVLVWMLRRNNAPLSSIAWLVPITLAGVFFQLNVAVLNVVISLRQQVGRIQALVFMAVLPRLALIALFAALGLLNAPLAVVSATVALAAQFWLLQRWVKPQISTSAPPSAEFRRDILAIVKRQAPLTVYFCVQGQIGIWLISIFGDAHRVADVGALGRIGMLFSILVSTSSALVVPRFARCQDTGRLRAHYALILSVFAAIILAGTVVAWLWPGSLLWLLGAKYAQLGDLVWLAVLAAGSGAFAGVLYGLNVNKGWIPPAAVMIPTEIITQIVLCLWFGVSTLRGILLMAVFAPIAPSVITMFVGLRKLRSAARVNPAMK